MAANCNEKTRAAIDVVLRRAFSEARSLAVSSQQHQQRYVATARLVGELRLLIVLNDDAALAILSPMRIAAPPTVSDATALCALLQVLSRMSSVCGTLVDCARRAHSVRRQFGASQACYHDCAGSQRSSSTCSGRHLLLRRRHPRPALRAVHVDRDVLMALAGFEQSECVSVLTKSVGVSAGHAILMARALSRWQH